MGFRYLYGLAANIFSNQITTILGTDSDFMSSSIEEVISELAPEISRVSLDAIDCGLLLVDQTGAIVLWNAWLKQTSGLSLSEVGSRGFDEIFSGVDGKRLISAMEDCLHNPAAMSSVLTGHPLPLYRKPVNGDGPKPVIQSLIVKPLDQEEAGRFCLVQVFDSQHQPPDAAMLQEKERLEVTLGSISDAVIITDKSERVVFLNAVAEELTGWKIVDARGNSLDGILQLVSEAVDSDAMLYGNDEFGYMDPGLILVGAHGAQIPVELSVASLDDGMGGSSGSVIVFRDVTSSRRMAAQLFWQSNHDALTGLANRIQFERRLNLLLRDREDDGRQHAVLYLDVDQFKIINDTCGHAAGDDLLRQLTGLLKREVRRSDTLARVGGDEFGILLEDCPLSAALRVTNELRQLVSDFRFNWEGKIFPVAISIGLVPFDALTLDAAEILSAADTACFSAKDSGRDRVHVFEAGKSEASRRHGEMQWVSHIHSALDNNRLTLFSQLIVPVDGSSDLIPHREVLLRMYDEEGNIIPPGAFIPAAERYNLMPSLDRWVVGAALDHFARLRDQKQTAPFMMNINLSGASLVQEGFLDFVLEQLNSREIPHWMICFEVTETAAIANLEDAKKFITALRGIGCKFALDDFGSGLSSFGYLKHLPIDFLKIDGSFIQDIVKDPIHGAMVEAINRVGHIMGVHTVAEFVEDAKILERLKEIGVDYAQGYHIERPAPIADMT
jgi:Amt family ammonium transporter